MSRVLRSAAAALSALLVSGSGAYAAEQYMTEVTVFGSKTNGNQGSRTRFIGGTAEMFFLPVNTGEHPYAEAAFLERIGSVRLLASKIKFDGDLEGDGPVWGFGLNLAKPGFPLAVKVMYTRSELDVDRSLSGSGTSTGNDFDGRVGAYFTKTLLAGLEYAYGSTKFDLAEHRTARARDYGVFARYVIELRRFREVSIEANLLRSTMDEAGTLRNTKEAIAADYYFSKGLSAGAGFENSGGTDAASEGQAWSVNVRYFLTPLFSMQAVYGRFLNSNDGRENDTTYELIIAGRF